MKANDAGQVSKEDAKYVSGSSDPSRHCCGLCTWVFKDHDTNKHYCKKVEGEVTDLAGCKEFFDLNLIKWANWKIPITK